MVLFIKQAIERVINFCKIWKMSQEGNCFQLCLWLHHNGGKFVFGLTKILVITRLTWGNIIFCMFL